MDCIIDMLARLRDTCVVYGLSTLVVAPPLIWLLARCARVRDYVAVSLALAVALFAGFPSRSDKGPIPSRFTFDSYLRDAGSYATNDTAHVAAIGAIAELPLEGCDIWLFVQDRANPTNAAGEAVWTQHPDIVPFTNPFAHDYEVAGATNCDYTVLINYIPPTPVHTNGVFELRGFEIDEADAERAAAFISTGVTTEPDDSDQQ